MNSWSSGQPKNDAKTLFSTLHPLSMVIFATATVVAFILLCNSRFNFHCYTQCEAMPTQKSARKWRCDLSQLLVWKITKGIHSCKPVSLNRPIKWYRLMKSYWWWQYSDRSIISHSPHLHIPIPPFSPSLISLMVSVDIKHHVYLLTHTAVYFILRLSKAQKLQPCHHFVPQAMSLSCMTMWWAKLHGNDVESSASIHHKLLILYNHII